MSYLVIEGLLRLVKPALATVFGVVLYLVLTGGFDFAPAPNAKPVKPGKYKMVAQCWTVGALMTMVAGSDFWVWAAVLGFWASLVLTVVSGLNYCFKARAILLAGAA